MAAIARASVGRGQGHSDGPGTRSDLGLLDTEPEGAGRAPLCQGRFRKVRDGIRPGGTAEAGNGHGAQRAHTRSSSVLSKAAQLESKILSRKKQLELQNSEPGPKPSDKESSSSASRHERGARGKKYLKNRGSTRGSGTRRDASSEEEKSIQSPKKNVMAKQQFDVDSDEEEVRELMNSLGFSRAGGNWEVVVSDAQQDGKNKTPVPSGRPPLSHKEIAPTDLSKASSFHNKDSQERVNSPTSRNLSGHTLRSSMNDNTVKMALSRPGYIKQSQECLGSDRSEIKSLDELFSNADDAEDLSSSSSNDFKLNILSLDDLAPDVTSQAAELKQKGKDIEISQESNKNMMVEEDQASLKTTSAGTGVNDASEGDVERSVSEGEISEHLSGASTDSPGHKQGCLDHDERTLNSEYSEDFERSLSTTDRESVSRTSEGHVESCPYSGEHLSSASCPLVTQERHKQGHQVTVREAGVQTAGLPFTYCWAQANTSAVLSPPAGTSYIEPVPIASHIISMEALEALTTYSPSVLVLQTMFKQHLMLTQQFVENVHHLHSSLVDSLEQEKFHYHTLEEAKEYIKNHKSPPLTLEQALEEIQRAQEE